MSRIPAIYKNIHKLRERYYKQAFSKEALLDLLSETEVSEHVYESNAIENSTLSLEETEKILLKIELDRYITERELFEAKNLARVVEYINIKAKDMALNLDLILLLHKMLLSNIRDEVAGRFRLNDEWVKVGYHLALDPKLIVEELQVMLSNYYGSHDEHIIKRIARFHLMFEHIHPFVDGNGRIGRVLNNYLLIREGFVPVNIKFLDRKEYYNAFSEFDESGKSSLMETIVGRALSSSYHKRLAYLEGKKIMTLGEYSKKRNLSYTNLLNKAKRQTIEAFIEKGTWKIGG